MPSRGFPFMPLKPGKLGIIDKEVNAFTCESLFSTLTNVNFDQKDFVDRITRTVRMRKSLKDKVAAKGGKTDFAAPAANLNRQQWKGSLPRRPAWD